MKKLQRNLFILLIATWLFSCERETMQPFYPVVGEWEEINLGFTYHFNEDHTLERIPAFPVEKEWEIRTDTYNNPPVYWMNFKNITDSINHPYVMDFSTDGDTLNLIGVLGSNLVLKRK